MTELAAVDLLIEKYTAQMGVSRAMLTLTQGDDFFLDEVIYRLVRKVATLPSRDELRVPRRWHDAFVEEYRAARGLRGLIARQIEKRHPVEWTTYRAVEFLPNYVALDPFRGVHRLFTWEQTGGFDD